MADAQHLKDLTREIIDEILNKGEFDRYTEYFTPDFVEHNPDPNFSPDLQGTIDSGKALLRAFPDLHFRIDHIFAEGDMVCVVNTQTGTHQGEFMGIQPTLKSIEVLNLDVLRFEDDKLAEHWGLVDENAVLEQLGLMPFEEEEKAA